MPKSQPFYLCFEITDTEDFARAVYVKRFKQKPREILRANGLLWVGPVPDQLIHLYTTKETLEHG